MKPLIIANWKMNPVTLQEAKRSFELIKKAVENMKEVEVIICPPFIFLPVLKPNKKIGFGAQDCFWEDEKGAFTSAISPAMLKSLGCQYVILGHSERRVYFKEDDRIINKKVKAALRNGLKVILCAGEKKEGKLQELQRQLEKNLENIKKSDLANLVLAYEPIWAIGGFGGRPASVKEAIRGAAVIRKTLSKIFGETLAKKIKILYGGSASQNPEIYIYEAGMAGLVIGSTSAMAKEFINVLEAIRFPRAA